ncbi:sensor histidine kinase [Cytobacillus oceanisediminis]|jgi:signal transduction histidine kinase|uniref:sensor histidine kinase n=1 Tax=Cytobacillus TaxID=2675230 RepID=UPI001C23F683|nr:MULTISPECIES: sensor histidine kinase [Cytobacillus]MBY0156619.1 sensor histidine kinase [Cytobacillus firmus]MBU8730208.1 sensor histidine kinase [Cytobacillus oceanisediminis]MCM3391115.1 sensor histidine kinase [Cytobacillus oceanisediminis]MCM3531513.1 sensor histidine kinase [Cytobacillus oceanisediminis]UQX52729.1 sensor histidine kinase [Cytobacillus pseudoceanisediminis]
MKLFLKEHALLIAVQVVQFFIILAIYWLDGYRHLLPALYGIFLGLFLLTAYLTYHYFSRRKFYKRLTEELASLDDSFQTTENSPISQALDHLLKEQYRHYQTRIKELESRQEEHLKFMDQWVHQMKTPLSVIELIAQNLDEPDSSSIREETDRMKTGLNTILYMARLRTIEQDFHIKPVHLSQIIHEVNGENKRLYIRNGVYPNLLQEKQDMIVETDEKWLFFMLSQLINNAVKYSRGKSNRIDISIFEKNGEAVLEVKDFGAGIPEADKRRVFEPFYTGENGRKFRESTGMGLYLTKEAADHLGHRIELESKMGEGSLFRLIFGKTQNLTAL